MELLGKGSKHIQQQHPYTFFHVYSTHYSKEYFLNLDLTVWYIFNIIQNKLRKKVPFIAINSFLDRLEILRGISTTTLENSLAVRHPNLLVEWNYEKNDGISPFDVSRGSKQNVWWKCQKGHEWQAIISNRTAGRNCPYCSGTLRKR